MKIHLRKRLLTIGAILFSTTGFTALPPPLVPAPPMKLGGMQAAFSAAAMKPDEPGTGAYPSIKEVDPSLADHVVYRPANLANLGAVKLGIVAWGNGGCSADGTSSRFHLEELASHGYLVIASGKMLTGHEAPTPPVAAANPKDALLPPTPPPAQTTAASLTKAIDWALSENLRVGSRYYARLDPQQVAVSGWSCGGVQALNVASDPRVKTVVIHNSGLFERGKVGMAEMDIGKEALAKLHTPIIYILGGPSDIAYPQAVDDFSRISNVPVFVASNDKGHGGTFLDENGGIAAAVAVSWLDWQLRGDRQAAKRFVGVDCGLCTDTRWNVDSKGIN